MDPTIDADLFTTLINQYTAIFSSYFGQFLHWGQWLFYSFATIGIVWFCLWQAFDTHSAVDAMPGFLREFFLIGFFYTVMINAGTWLGSIVDTAQSMSQTLTHQQIDPASIIQQGMTIANQVLAPVKDSAAANLGIGATFIVITYLLVLASFIAVALNLSLTLLMTTFLISLSGLSLAFGSFATTRPIARKTLDVVTAYCVKLLALYLVVNAGAGIFVLLSQHLPTQPAATFDIYGWTIAAALLFCCTAYVLPRQAGRLFMRLI